MTDNPKTAALLAAMRPGEFRKVAPDQNLYVTRDGLAAYVITDSGDTHPYLHTCATERARVEALLIQFEGITQ